MNAENQLGNEIGENVPLGKSWSMLDFKPIRHISVLVTLLQIEKMC